MTYRRITASLVAAGLGVAGLGVVGAPAASANYPEPPSHSSGVTSKSYLSESAPAQCRPGPAPYDTMRAWIDVRRLCLLATAAAPSPEAAGAIRYAFSKLGANYSQWNRNSVNPPVFDCSSMVGRAYQAAGARLKRYDTGAVRDYYPSLGWTGAYVGSNYGRTNLVKLASATPLKPGDVLIAFDGSDPANSYGNNGHAQIYLGYYVLHGQKRGTHLVIHSSGQLRVVPWKWGAGWFSNEWHFRYTSLNAKPAAKPAPKPAPKPALRSAANRAA